MGVIASISLLISANTAEFGKGLKKATDGATDFAGKATKSADRVGAAFAGMGRTAAGGLGSFAKDVAAAAGGMAVFRTAQAGLETAFNATVGAVGQAIDRIDQLTDTAAQLGVTTESLSGLRHAANLTGSSAEDLDGALEKLNANLGDAAQKATPAGDALTRLGLDAKQLAGIPADQAFRKIVGGFEKLPNAADRASVAMDIFGKGGLRILNTLSSGSGEVDRLAEEAARFGVAINQVDAAKIGAAKDSLDRMAAAVSGLGNAAAVALAPAIEVAATEMTNFLGETVAQAGGVERALAGIAGFFGGIADGAAYAQEQTQRFMLTAIKAYAALESASSWIPGTDAKPTQDFARAFEEDINRAFASKPSDKIGKFLDDIKAKAASAAQVAADSAKANLGSAAADGLGGLGKEVADLTEKLKEQVVVWGLTGDEADIAKLKMKGATAEQLAAASAAADRLKVLDMEKKANDEEKKAADDLWKSTRTDAEKYAQELEKIALYKSKGLIDGDTADRAIKKAAKDNGQPDEPRLAGAAKLGSAEAYSAIASALTGNGGFQDRQLGYSRDTAAGIRQLVELMRSGGGGPIGFDDDVIFNI